MRNPTLKQLDKVIKNLEKANEIAKQDAPISMMNGCIPKEKNVCGTPMCHGGWYAIATYKDTKGKTYWNGAQKIANHLGFATVEDLERWAYQKPEIWGNGHGESMFSSGSAFNQPNDEGFTLQTIINHWGSVRDRIANLN